MKTFAIAAVLAAVLAGRFGLVAAAGESDDDRIQGDWSVTAGEKAGHAPPGEGFKNMTVGFHGGSFHCKSGDHAMRGTYTLDTSETPGKIAIKAGDMELAGVYRLEGDELKICVGAHGDRPAEFATPKGSRRMLLILARKQP